MVARMAWNGRNAGGYRPSRKQTVERVWPAETGRAGNARLFRPPPSPRRSIGASALAAVLGIGLLLVWYGPMWIAGVERVATQDQPTAASADSHAARFSFCHSGGGVNCVVDGDTFWFRGEKYRIADIDMPETHGPRCVAEGALGARATQRLQVLMNAGPFSLESGDRDSDRYGRSLRVVTRGGRSIGAQLVAEGLARDWDGARHSWC